MTERFLSYSLRVLDAQYKHIATRPTPAERERQQAYYDGMKQMLEIAVSNAYAAPYYIELRADDFDGEPLHAVVKEA